MTKNVTKRKGKLLTKPSQDVERLLELINLVLPEAELPDVEEIRGYFYQKTYNQLKDEENLEDYEIETEIIENFTAGIDTDTANFIVNKMAEYADLESEICRIVGEIEQIQYDSSVLYDFLHCFNEFAESRKTVRYIAKLAQSVRENGYDFFAAGFSRFLLGSIDLAIEPRISPDGLFTFQKDLAVKVFEGVPTQRLRICLYCDRVFWASRSDKFGCSFICNQNIRSRRRRKKVANRFLSRIKK